MTGRQETIAVEARITGRVQGVWFRAWTRQEARRLGVAGWVRNEADGSVRALFAGPRERVEAMLGRCREGPPAARVDGVETRPVAQGSDPHSDPAFEVQEFRVID